MFLIWIAWFVGNLGSNALLFMGNNYNPVFSVVGKIIYFVTITSVGILAACHYSKEWKIEIKLNFNHEKKIHWIFSILLIIFVIVMGYFAMEEAFTESFTLNSIFDQSFQWIITPIFVLIPTMIAYTLLWYALFLRSFEKIFSKNIVGKILAIVLTSFVYSIYHFGSIDEIFTLQGILDEVLITFMISIIFSLYVMLTNNLHVAFIANLILNWFVFTPVETFHIVPIQLLWNYVIVCVCVVVYFILFKRPKTSEQNVPAQIKKEFKYSREKN